MHVFDSNLLQYKYSVTVTVNYCTTVFKKKLLFDVSHACV